MGVDQTRDPRRDPIPGDVLGVGRARYRVVHYRIVWTGPVRVAFRLTSSNHLTHLPTLHQWRRMMRHPEVIVHAVGVPDAG